MTRRRERGFTLVETLASLTVFSIITIGVIPLMGDSMRALGVSRDRTVAENVVRAAVERLEGIRYYVSWDAKAKKVDLLDYYLPQTAGTFAPGQSYGTSVANPPLVAPTSGGTGVFTTVCPPPAGTNQACPSDIPAGYRITFTASFVEPVTNTTPQTYRVVNPGASYSASPAVAGTCSVAPCTDKPPADLVDLKVTGSWTYGGTPHNFAVRSMVGERTFSSGVVNNATPPSPGATPAPTSVPANPGAPVRMRGNATIDHVLRAETGYALTSGSFPAACATEPCNHSEMIFTLGSSDARIETKDTSVADVETRHAEARVIRTYPAGTTPPANPPPDLNYVRGATSILHAPPYDYRAVDDVKTAILDVPNADQPSALQARIYQHENFGMLTDVSNELPRAEGGFRTPTGATGELEWYLNNTQRDPSNTGPMHIDTTQPLIWGMKYATTTGSSSLTGTTKVNTGALGTPGRRVESSASFRIPWIYYLRIYAGTNGRDSFSMLTIYDFVASVNCKATANPTTATATGSWSFSFQYYHDATNNGRQANSLGSGTVYSNGPDILNGATVPDALAALKAQNPLMWDGAPTNGCCTSTSDTYLFDVRTGSTSTSTRGYITDWSSNKNVETRVSADGRETSATINGALRIETAGFRQTMSPELPQTAYSLSFGKLRCSAVDNR